MIETLGENTAPISQPRTVERDDDTALGFDALLASIQTAQLTSAARLFADATGLAARGQSSAPSPRRRCWS